MRSKRILVTGFNGMLGKDICFVFSNNGNFDVYGADLIQNDDIPLNQQFIGDLTAPDFTKKMLEAVNPDIIIHCAAIVSLDKCESDKNLAKKIHVDVTECLAKYNINNTKMVYISTDSIFDGKLGNYSESDKPNPVNYYAKSKLDGEIKALENPNNIIARTNIFGFNKEMRGSIAEWAIQNIVTKKSINGFTDTIFNAIYTKHLANIMLKLVQMDYKGIINVASANFISKYDFLRLLAMELNFPESLIIKSSSSMHNFITPRPLNTTLNINKLKDIVDVPLIEDGIRDLVLDYSSKEIIDYEEY